jgi:hypothetical protein
MYKIFRLLITIVCAIPNIVWIIIGAISLDKNCPKYAEWLIITGCAVLLNWILVFIYFYFNKSSLTMKCISYGSLFGWYFGTLLYMPSTLRKECQEEKMVYYSTISAITIGVITFFIQIFLQNCCIIRTERQQQEEEITETL